MYLDFSRAFDLVQLLSGLIRCSNIVGCFKSWLISASLGVLFIKTQHLCQGFKQRCEIDVVRASRWPGAQWGSEKPGQKVGAVGILRLRGFSPTEFVWNKANPVGTEHGDFSCGSKHSKAQVERGGQSPPLTSECNDSVKSKLRINYQSNK